MSKLRISLYIEFWTPWNNELHKYINILFKSNRSNCFSSSFSIIFGLKVDHPTTITAPNLDLSSHIDHQLALLVKCVFYPELRPDPPPLIPLLFFVGVGRMWQSVITGRTCAVTRNKALLLFSYERFFHAGEVREYAHQLDKSFLQDGMLQGNCAPGRSLDVH